MTDPLIGVELLNPASVVGHLARRGLIDPGTATVERLGGGVSNVVLAVADNRRRLVVKQALPRLRVAAEWTAPTERTLTEAHALALAGDLVPEGTPPVVDLDDRRQVLVIARAPEGWVDWKSLLLAGVVDDHVATRLGEALATWHSSTVAGTAVPARVATATEAFDRLRVEPFYRATARRRPDLADEIRATADLMLSRRVCMVHGDFSPKNVLVDPAGDGQWVIDFEVAHVGDPAFDAAFLLCHLTLKSIHRPEHAVAYDRCVDAFTTSYARQVSSGLEPDWPYVLRHVGCLLLARVHGTSPAEYLDADQAQLAARLGADLLARTPAVEDLAARRQEAVR